MNSKNRSSVSLLKTDTAGEEELASQNKNKNEEFLPTLEAITS